MLRKYLKLKIQDSLTQNPKQVATLLIFFKKIKLPSTHLEKTHWFLKSHHGVQMWSPQLVSQTLVSQFCFLLQRQVPIRPYHCKASPVRGHLSTVVAPSGPARYIPVAPMEEFHHHLRSCFFL